MTRSSFGEVTTVPLIAGGSSVPVTMENRTEYVRAYVRYVLDESVKEPFLAFDEGFKRVCDGKVLVSPPTARVIHSSDDAVYIYTSTCALMYAHITQWNYWQVWQCV